MQIDLIPRALCHSLLADLRDHGVEDIPANDPRVDAELGKILEFIEEQCRQAYAANNLGFVDECLLVLDKLGPDATTGRHDLFWAKIRELQPGSLSFRNPTYKTASLADHVTNEPPYDLSEEWKNIVSQSSRKMATAIRR